MQIPTHYCTICLAKWRKHENNTWSLCDKESGTCCNNVAMGEQIKPLPDVANIEDHMAISCEDCGSATSCYISKVSKMHKYRIVYVSHDGDPCHWQAQERKWIFFWVNLFGNVSSATTAANIITNVMKVRKEI